MPKSRPASVDEYLSNVPSDAFRAQLERLRETILGEAPELEECISYGMPCYKFHGMVAGFAAFKKHCSFFPGHTVRDFTDELAGFKTNRGTVQFTVEHPLPNSLVRAMIRARVDENIQAARDAGKD